MIYNQSPDSSALTWQFVGNTANIPEFAVMLDLNTPFWTGDFTGSGRTQFMAWDKDNGRLWWGAVDDTGQLAWQQVGNADVFSQTPYYRFWTGDFSGSGCTQILVYYTLDINAYVTDEMRKSGGDGPPLEANSIIAQAMQAQLGLKVEAKKMPLEVLVIDKMEKTPTEN